MNAEVRTYRHEELTRRIIAVFFEVYGELGYGFLESVYRSAMTIALGTQGSAHVAQLLNYLRCTVIEVGLILNFGPSPKVRRLVFANHRKHPPFTQAH